MATTAALLFIAILSGAAIGAGLMFWWAAKQIGGMWR